MNRTPPQFLASICLPHRLHSRHNIYRHRPHGDTARIFCSHRFHRPCSCRMHCPSQALFYHPSRHMPHCGTQSHPHMRDHKSFRYRVPCCPHPSIRRAQTSPPTHTSKSIACSYLPLVDLRLFLLNTVSNFFIIARQSPYSSICSVFVACHHAIHRGGSGVCAQPQAST